MYRVAAPRGTCFDLRFCAEVVGMVRMVPELFTMVMCLIPMPSGRAGSVRMLKAIIRCAARAGTA